MNDQYVSVSSIIFGVDAVSERLDIKTISKNAMQT